METKIGVTLVTLESHNHVAGDIERGVKIYNQGGVEFEERESGAYWARVPHKNDFKMVTVQFTRDGQDIEHYTCHCTIDYKDSPVCRHVVAAVLAIQGGVIESNLTLGKTYSFEFCVTEQYTAKSAGSGSLDILATPSMIAMMEHAACALLEDALDAGQTSVGTSANVAHTAASPVGIMAAAEAKITSARGRAITFEVSARDEAGEIGKGTHTRVIVDEKRFIEKTNGRIKS